jgi:hypothetical protein
LFFIIIIIIVVIIRQMVDSSRLSPHSCPFPPATSALHLPLTSLQKEHGDYVCDRGFWADALKKKLAGRSSEIDFEGYFATHSFAAAIDVPFNVFVDEMLAVCPPTTKFLLTDRDAESWFGPFHIDDGGSSDRTKVHQLRASCLPDDLFLSVQVHWSSWS